MIKSFNCLYTTQKTKKRKAWNDGILKMRLVEIAQSTRPLATSNATAGGAAGGGCRYGGTGYLLSADDKSMLLDQSLSSRALSADEIQLLLSNDVCILEMDAYLINIEADPSQWKSQHHIKQSDESFSDLANPNASSSFKHVLKLPKFKVPSSRPVSVSMEDNGSSGNGRGGASNCNNNNNNICNNNNSKKLRPGMHEDSDSSINLDHDDYRYGNNDSNNSNNGNNSGNRNRNNSSSNSNSNSRNDNDFDDDLDAIWSANKKCSVSSSSVQYGNNGNSGNSGNSGSNNNNNNNNSNSNNFQINGFSYGDNPQRMAVSAPTSHYHPDLDPDPDVDMWVSLPPGGEGGNRRFEESASSHSNFINSGSNHISINVNTNNSSSSNSSNVINSYDPALIWGIETSPILLTSSSQTLQSHSPLNVNVPIGKGGNSNSSNSSSNSSNSPNSGIVNLGGGGGIMRGGDGGGVAGGGDAHDLSGGYSRSRSSSINDNNGVTISRNTSGVSLSNFSANSGVFSGNGGNGVSFSRSRSSSVNDNGASISRNTSTSNFSINSNFSHNNNNNSNNSNNNSNNNNSNNNRSRSNSVNEINSVNSIGQNQLPRSQSGSKLVFNDSIRSRNGSFNSLISCNIGNGINGCNGGGGGSGGLLPQGREGAFADLGRDVEGSDDSMQTNNHNNSNDNNNNDNNVNNNNNKNNSCSIGYNAGDIWGF